MSTRSSERASSDREAFGCADVQRHERQKMATPCSSTPKALCLGGESVSSRSLSGLFTTFTAKSTPTFSSVPDFSLGRSFVPKRFQTSGGSVPKIRIVFPALVGAGSVGAPGLGSGPGVIGPTAGGCAGSGGADVSPAFAAFALALVRRNTSLSKPTSSGATSSLNHTRSFVPSERSPEASPNLRIGQTPRSCGEAQHRGRAAESARR